MPTDPRLYASHLCVLHDRGAAEGLAIQAFAASAAGEARELAQEWTEQRSIFHSRLYDQCIRPPLQVGFGASNNSCMLLGMAAGRSAYSYAGSEEGQQILQPQIPADEGA